MDVRAHLLAAEHLDQLLVDRVVGEDVDDHVETQPRRIAAHRRRPHDEGRESGLALLHQEEDEHHHQEGGEDDLDRRREGLVSLGDVALIVDHADFEVRPFGAVRSRFRHALQRPLDDGERSARRRAFEEPQLLFDLPAGNRLGHFARDQVELLIDPPSTQAKDGGGEAQRQHDRADASQERSFQNRHDGREEESEQDGERDIAIEPLAGKAMEQAAAGPRTRDHHREQHDGARQRVPAGDAGGEHDDDQQELRQEIVGDDIGAVDRGWIVARQEIEQHRRAADAGRGHHGARERADGS